MKKVTSNEASLIIGGSCAGLLRRADGQAAKGHFARASRILDRFERRCT